MQRLTDLSSPASNNRLSPRTLRDFYDRLCQSGLAVNTFILMQDGEVTAAYSRPPYRLDQPQLLYSLSKSITSIAAGIAVDEGLLRLTDTVMSFFPYKLPDTISANLSRMTVHHLLSMNAGHRDNIYGAVTQEEDWVRAFLAQEVPLEPGSHYVYSTHCTYMLSAIIEQAAGANLVDYLMPRLFKPLDIPRPVWETCPLGITAGGMGLSLSPESLAKLGQLLLNKGEYAGTRIVSEHYLRLASSEQSDNRQSAKAGRIDSAQGYGYQFHLCRRGCFRGDGSFGQLLLVAPQERIVIASTAAFPGMQQLQTLLDLIFEQLFDRLDQQAADSHTDFPDPVSTLTCLDPPAAPGKSTFSQPASVSADHPELKGTYHLDNNPHGLRSIILDMQGERLMLQRVYADGRVNVLPFHFTKRICAQDVFHKDLELCPQEVVTAAEWQSPDTLILTLVYLETPYIVTYTIGLGRPNSVQLTFQINVSLQIPEFSAAGVKDILS
ncbi:serine hydrolase domain-containing protein [Paenibacillus camerounensis]|uniref:serine hydrolase domain-containing protein n=1 Tax=Paenibacillus camerounensis TaxID=1243663 RepID=UPI0005A6D1C8|nr:serine hydrolase [Paenibacillus camerounensis]